ncbi:MAG: class I SAM-dependent methyltransferase [Actinomycetota bacterium]
MNTTLEWTSETAFSVAGEPFTCGYHQSNEQALTVRKPPYLVTKMVELMDAAKPDLMMELGIAQGGSVALTSLAIDPEQLVAVELNGSRVDLLDAFLRRHDRKGRVHLHYGVDQSDRSRLADIARTHFGHRGIDLIIDDASHRLAATRASFETLFPRLRPGGLYVIEDWSWQLATRRMCAKVEDALGPDDDRSAVAPRGSIVAVYLENANQPPLERLAVEILLAQATRTGAIASVRADADVCIVERGDVDLDPESFRIADYFVDYSDYRRILDVESRP